VTLDRHGQPDTCRGRVVVNAAGPWADKVAGLVRDHRPVGGVPRLRLVKGSHIVVPRIAGADDAFLLQNSDGRVVFVLPFEGAFTLIGTTDVAFDGDPADVACSPEEDAYLLAAANRFLATPLERSDIVWRFAGVRPLQADEDERNPAALSRDYQVEVTGEGHGTILLTIVGGKVTTYRRLAEEVLTRLAPAFPGLAPAWTADRPLPGGDFPGGDFGGLLAGLTELYPWLPAGLRFALARRHGALTGAVLGDATGLAELGADLGAGLTEREVVYFRDREWARTPDDILWRRTKAGLHLADDAERSRTTRRIAALL
jgi:glycerol-3-phosphate dehydrogenase